MAGYVLKAKRFLHVRLDKANKVVVRKRYNRGDALDALNAEEIERLVALGAAAEVTDDAGEAEGDESTPEATEGQDGATEGQGDEAETYEGSEWDKGRLQAEAESRGLSKSGTVAELAERLRDYDVAQQS